MWIASARFVRITAENFPVRDVSADMAYSSRRNLHAVDDVGGTPYIPFKTGAVAKAKGRRPTPCGPRCIITSP